MTWAMPPQWCFPAGRPGLAMHREMASRMVHAQVHGVGQPVIPVPAPKTGTAGRAGPVADQPVATVSWEQVETSLAGVASFEHPAVRAAFEEFRAVLSAKAHFHLDSSDLIRRSIVMAVRAHDGANRKSGEPYVIHPLLVGSILATMQLDPETVAAGVLHDVVEDTPVEIEEIETQFGERVARLVDGVTKLGQIPWQPGIEGSPRREHWEQAQLAENLRKMFLAMVDDIGVVLIKLADRLHNMRTLDAVPPHKQVRTAQQTMEIYAPLANRLGIWHLKSELEDLAFKYIQPDAYAEISTKLTNTGRNRDTFIDRFIRELHLALDQAGIQAEISGRGKHLFSIHRKMQRKGRSFDQIYDVVGVRVIVENHRDCYGALGIIHQMFHPIPGEFDDYIATPKESLYQSLHTAVIGPDGQPLEIQIRTLDMHRIAEYGVAAHWRYKEGGKGDSRLEQKIAWLRQLMDWRDEVADAEEFVESLKSDVFQDMIYVFTPAGDIVELPSGATPLDFAYRIHTEVGHRCVGARVNEQIVSLDSKLRNGQVVRIQTSKTREPSRDWLLAGNGYVTTASAREKIRQWFRRAQRDENVLQGKDILDKELRRLSLNAKPDDILKHFPRYHKFDDLVAAIGYGAVSPQSVTAKLAETQPEEFTIAPIVPRPRSPAQVEVMGAGGLLTSLANCCKPVAGDRIIGYVTRGRGISIHRTDCANMTHLPDPERQIEVSWGADHCDTFAVSIRLEALDRVGLLKDVSISLADAKVNIIGVNTTTHDDRGVTMMLTLEVEDINQLSRILRKLEDVRDVISARREAAPGAHLRAV